MTEETGDSGTDAADLTSGAPQPPADGDAAGGTGTADSTVPPDGASLPGGGGTDPVPGGLSGAPGGGTGSPAGRSPAGGLTPTSRTTTNNTSTAFSATVSAEHSRKFALDMSATTKVSVKIVAVPPPANLMDALKAGKS